VPKKNIVLFIGNDVVAHMFLNHFIPKMVADGINPILVMVTGKKPKAYNHTELNRYHFYENQLLNDIIYPHINNGTSEIKLNSLTPSQLITKYDLQTISTTNVNAPELREQLETMDFMGAISVRCFQIFKTNIIKSMQAKGFFCNSHPGILPYHKGVFCMLRGIVNDQKHLGWTLHEIDEGIDTGRIIKRLPIKNMNISNPIPLYEQSIESLSDAWNDYILEHVSHGYVDSYKQNLTGKYYTYPTESEISQWVANGKLDKIETKKMVAFYYNMFIPRSAKFTAEAMNFKILLINKISQFETLMEHGTNVVEFDADITKQIAA